jgi:hypothetical protein
LTIRNMSPAPPLTFKVTFEPSVVCSAAGAAPRGHDLACGFATRV